MCFWFFRFDHRFDEALLLGAVITSDVIADFIGTMQTHFPSNIQSFPKFVFKLKFGLKIVEVFMRYFHFLNIQWCIQDLQCYLNQMKVLHSLDLHDHFREKWL